MKDKSALLCSVGRDVMVNDKDVECIYEVRLVFHREGLDGKVVGVLNIWTRGLRREAWEEWVRKIQATQQSVTIAIVGKYVDLTEAYKSLNEALCHGGVANYCKVNLIFVDSEKIEDGTCGQMLADVDGILVPGGFGNRGIEGKICSANHARVNKIPYFGICLGMQVAVVEFARNVAGLKDANSSEFNDFAPDAVIYLMLEWFDERSGTVQRRDESSDKGATMRLGAYPCRLPQGTLAYRAYSVGKISERHRHRYEFNNDYKALLVEKGMVVSGSSATGDLVEIIEIKDHPWFLGC